jgi:signal transduction histidine kinase
MFIFMNIVFTFQIIKYNQLQRSLAETYKNPPPFHHEVDYLMGQLGEANLLFRYYTVEFDSEIYALYQGKMSAIQAYVDSLASLPIVDNPLLNDTIHWEQHEQFALEFATLKQNLEQLMLLSVEQEAFGKSATSANKQTISFPVLDRYTVTKTEKEALADTVVIKRPGLLKRIFQSKPDTIIVPQKTVLSAQNEKIERIHEQIQNDLKNVSKAYKTDLLHIQKTFRQLQDKDRQLIHNHFHLLDQITRNLEALRLLQKEKDLSRSSDELKLYQTNSITFEKQLGWAMVTMFFLVILLLVYHFYANRFERKLVQERELARQNADVKTNLLAEISHEIRTPLNCLLEVTEQLQSKQEWLKQPELKTLLESASYNIKISNQNIQDILQLSKVESGQAEPKMEHFYVFDMLTEVARLHANQLKHKNIELIQDIKIPQKLVINNDAFRIRQVLSNFLSNAIKYTHQGKIWVRANIEQKKQGSFLKIEVEDTGQGMSNTQLDLIFRKYYTVQKHLGSGGTGIGLYLSKLFITQLNGEIGVKSNLGKGSIFHAQIPVEVMEHATLFHEAHQIAELPSDLRILVVDDQPINHLIMKPLLTRFQEVHYAYSGIQALEICQQHVIDVVLTDIIMPGMDGWELLKQIKSLKQTPKVVIALSADVLLAEQKQGYESYAFDGILPKPPTEKSLANCLYPLLKVQDT